MGAKDPGNTPSRPAKIKSMTGFAAAVGAIDPWHFTMDLRAVNGRGLDLRLRVPDWVDGLEAEARKLLQAAIGRGSVTLSVRVGRDETPTGTHLNYDALNNALSNLHHIETAAESAGLTLSPMRASDIASLRGVLEAAEETAEDTAPLKSEILKALKTLVVEFNADRAREGAALNEILTGQIAEISRLREAALEALGDRAEAQKAALERNLAKLLDAGDMPDETRLAQELALIAVKTDVSEEVDRLAAHVDGARALLNETGPVGRKLDFLMQEFNREANTLCSKAQSGDLTRIGLDLKTVIDQMREQVQNVE